MTQHRLTVQLTIEYELDVDDGVPLMDIVMDLDNDVWDGHMTLDNGGEWYGGVTKWKIVNYEENSHIISATSAPDHQ